jgi:multiple sugar transport system substrate-binding protein
VRRHPWALLAVVGVLSSGCTSVAAGQDPTVLRVVMADDWASTPAVTEVIGDFESEHPGVTVVVQASPFSQIPEVVGGAIDLGEPHDLAHWHAFAAAAAGLAQPLDDLWDEAGLQADEFLPGAVSGVTWSGQRYGVPLDTNALVLMVNDRKLDAHLDREPSLATIDGFRETVDALSLADDRYALAVSSSSWIAYGWIVAHGGSLVSVDDTGTPTFTFEDPATLDALELLATLVRDGDAPRPFAPDLAAETVQAFSSGNNVMHTSGSWDLPQTWRTTATSIASADVSVRPLPQADPDQPRTVLGGSSLFVPVGAEHRELAFDLMLRLTADDVALRLVAEEGRLPARTRVLADEVFMTSPDLAAFVQQLEHAEVMELIAYPEVAGAFREGLEAVLSERRSVEEAMGEVQRYADTWLAEAGG